MYKIGVLGDRDSVYGFGALGLEVFPVEEPEAGAKLLRRLAEEGYAVLYVTEALCAQIPDELERLRERPLPAVIPIPGISGNTGLGLTQLKHSVEQAVGSDILSAEDES